MPDAEFSEDIRKYLPKYLSPQDTSELFGQLASFPQKSPFYLTRGNLAEDLLQGDGWRGFVAIDFWTAERKEVAGVIISNSCDIDPSNHRDLAMNILFSPLIELSKYVDLLRGVKNEQQIAATLGAIRGQKVTSIFYLPEGHWGAEGIVLLDTVHVHPLGDFLARPRTALFTLNQYAFYIFVLKLSIHFTRLNENVRRFDAQSAG